MANRSALAIERRGASLMYKYVRYCTTMNANEGVAPAVDSILRAARERVLPDRERISVQARSFDDALARAEGEGRVPVIAEVKPTSPTTDGERRDDPVTLAREMVAGGASALSVLTEPEHFGGSTAALERIRATVDVPVLRKDFVLQEAQLDAVTADLVLLIARFVEDLPGMVAAARERGFQVLVEVHTREELEQAIAADARLIGVNNRDLTRLEVDLSTFERIAPHVPDDATLVAESGVSTPADVRRMREAGADALLVGTAIMAGDVRENTRTLVEAAK